MEASGDVAPIDTIKDANDDENNVLCHYDNAEAAVGISAYLSPSIPGFSAVLKGRYSDFIVHEGK
jgi:hypothetical protein